MRGKIALLYNFKELLKFRIHYIYKANLSTKKSGMAIDSDLPQKVVNFCFKFWQACPDLALSKRSESKRSSGRRCSNLFVRVCKIKSWMHNQLAPNHFRDFAIYFQSQNPLIKRKANPPITKKKNWRKKSALIISGASNANSVM